MNTTLILFDVCGTIYNGNSTFDYLRFLILSKKYKILYFFICFAGARKIVNFFGKFFKKNIERYLVGRYFRGFTIEQLASVEEVFFEKYKKKLLLKKHLIKHCKYNRKNTYLLSASIDPPIRMLAHYLRIGFFCSELSTENGKYLGKISNDLLGNKSSIFKEKKILIEKYRSIILYTDNVEDIELIDYIISQHRILKIYIILNNNKNYWKNKINSLRKKYSSHFSYVFLQNKI